MSTELPVTNKTPQPERGGWLNRNKFKLAIGAMATSVVASVVAHPGGDTLNKALEVAPWAVPGVVAGEAAWIGGMALMAAGVGAKIGNPFKLHGRGDEIMSNVNESKTFKAGFWVNAAGAVATAGVVGGAVIAGLPPEAWGVMALPAVDLAGTIAARKVILTELHMRSNHTSDLNVSTDASIEATAPYIQSEELPLKEGI